MRAHLTRSGGIDHLALQFTAADIRLFQTVSLFKDPHGNLYPGFFDCAITQPGLYYANRGEECVGELVRLQYIPSACVDSLSMPDVLKKSLREHGALLRRSNLVDVTFDDRVVNALETPGMYLSRTAAGVLRFENETYCSKTSEFPVQNAA